MIGNDNPLKSSIKFLILLGIISLFADMTYEGARSITGPYLAILGASATVVGIVGGLGEFTGYGIRIIFGSLADRTRKYWTMTIFGYFLSLLAVPLLGLANYWEIAALLIIAERLGKAIRTPARDVMLSHAAKEMGSGWGFGFHEAMDQIGAVIGPLIISMVLYFKGGYSESFFILIIPAILALSVVILAKRRYPNPQEFEINLTQQSAANANNVLEEKGHKFPRTFWVYLAFVAISVGGYMNFQLISYHFKITSVISDAQIPLFFAIAMGTDALVALIIGRLFDKKGLLTLITIPILSIPIAPVIFSSSYGSIVIGIVLWGAVMGIQETIMKSVIADMIPIARRGLAYGIFNTAYGTAWFFGSTLMGVLYDVSISYIIFFSIMAELISVPLLFAVINRFKYAN